MQLQDYLISKVPFCLKDMADVFIEGCASLTPRQRTMAQIITSLFFAVSMIELIFPSDRKRFSRRADASDQLKVKLTIFTIAISSLCLLIILKKP